MRSSYEKVAVIGLGRVGLPHALVLADSGYVVYGVDVDKDVIEKLLRKEAPFYEPGMLDLIRRHVGKRFYPTTDMRSAVREADVVSINIGTRVYGHYKTDISNLLTLLKEIIKIGVAGKLLILRTTVPLGTTEKIRRLIEEATGLREGKDFYIAFMPERLVEGRAIEEERSLPKIIGVFSDEAYRIVKGIVERIGGEAIRAPSPLYAELVKLVDNSWRQTLFAFANDLALLGEELGIDIHEVIRIANKGYPRNNIPLPSYGVSGYCLTKDPYILEEAFKDVAERRGFSSIWYMARRVNDYMVEHVADIVVRSIRGEDCKICVLGLSYKEDIDDFRFSHGVDIANKLISMGYAVSVHDPYINYTSRYTDPRRYLNGNYSVAASVEECMRDASVVIVTVRHKEYVALDESGEILRLVGLMRKPPIVIDGWRVFNSLKDHKEVIYHGVGYSRR